MVREQLVFVGKSLLFIKGDFYLFMVNALTSRAINFLASSKRD